MPSSPLNRRDFLATSASLAAGVTLAAPALARINQPPTPSHAPTPPANPAAPKRTLRKAFYGHVDAPTVMDRLSMLRDAGFEGAELDSPTKIHMDEIRAAIEKTGVKVHGLCDSVHWRLYLNSPQPKVRAQALDALRTAIEDAHTLGAISILLVPAVVNKDHPYADAWRLTQEEIRKVLPLAKEKNVKIAMENVWNNFIMSPLEAAKYIDDFRSDMVGWHLDIGNMINFGWPEQWIATLGPRITKLHIKDFSRTKRDKEGLWKGFDVELGEGDADWPAVMRALDATGYSTAPKGNWATAEVRGGDLTRLTEIAKQMDKLFALQ
ncbi:MAG TPA: TIM barrel protein [Phycisphaerales bacterium]|nr:TIM barrel protein [Phycisphaerales bacterium]